MYAPQTDSGINIELAYHKFMDGDQNEEEFAHYPVYHSRLLLAVHKLTCLAPKEEESMSIYTLLTHFHNRGGFKSKIFGSEALQNVAESVVSMSVPSHESG
jgi:hypothetical protein